MHKRQQSLNELFNDALKTYRFTFAFEERNKDVGAKSVRCYLQLFLGGDSYGNHRENQVCGIYFRSPTVSRA
jgi:hypothetical protein